MCVFCRRQHSDSVKSRYTPTRSTGLVQEPVHFTSTTEKVTNFESEAAAETGKSLVFIVIDRGQNITPFRAGDSGVPQRCPRDRR